MRQTKRFELRRQSLLQVILQAFKKQLTPFFGWLFCDRSRTGASSRRIREALSEPSSALVREKMFIKRSTNTLIAIGAGLLIAACTGDIVGVSGIVEAPRYDVSAEMNGRITEVLVVEGDRVAANDLLIRIDCTQPELQLADARAARAAAEAQLDLVEAGPRDAEVDAASAAVEASSQQERLARHGATAEQLAQIDAGISATEARVHFARQSVARLETLGSSGSATQAELDSVRAELEVALAERERLRAQREEAEGGARYEERAILASQTERARAQLRALEEGARAEELALARTAIERADVGIQAAQEAVSRCEVRASRPGTVSIIDFEAGEVVGAGIPVVAIETDEAMTIHSYAPQTWLGDLEPGDGVMVLVDGFPDAPFEATITRIHDEAEFTPGNVQTPEDRMLLVYRMDLEIPDETPVPIRAGMSVTVDRLSGAQP